MEEADKLIIRTEDEAPVDIHEIINAAYFIKGLIEDEWTYELSVDEANYYSDLYRTIRHLLKQFDPFYLDKHDNLCEFYRQCRKTTLEDGRIRWVIDSEDDL